MRRVLVVLYNESGSSGGVERLNRILIERLRPRAKEWELNAGTLGLGRLPSRRLRLVVYVVMASILVRLFRLFFRRGVVVSNAYFVPFACVDYCLAHGCLASFFAAAQTANVAGALNLTVWLEREAYRRACSVLAVSDEVRQKLIDLYGLSADRVSVFHPVIAMPSTEEYLAKFCNKRVRIGFAGRLERMKGSDYLESTIGLLKEDCRYEFIVATPSSPPPEWVGFRNVRVMQGLRPDQMDEFYRSIDILILPSRSEGFELVTLEAIYSGVSVLANNLGSAGFFYRNRVPYVLMLPSSPLELVAQLDMLVSKLKAVWSGSAMRALIEDGYSAERYDLLAARIVSSVGRGG